MRKAISFILGMMLVLTSGLYAFAADAAVPSDVAGTKYEAAVKTLIEKDILSGYTDGTFKPGNAIDRAEACTVVVKSMDPKGAELFNAGTGKFTDVTGDYSWASKYINYATEKGVVAGYGNNLFKPSASVTYNEMATMLVNALGYSAKDLTGTWPENYVNKAKELGVFKDVEIGGKGDESATRGDVALMTAAVADKIAEANAPEVPSTPEEKPTSGAIDNGKLTDYSGRAYGVILSTSKVVNADKESVDQLEFLMGNKTYYLNTDGKVKVAADVLTGDLYCLKMTNGVVKKIETDGTAIGNKYYKEYTTSKAFEEVANRSKTVVTTEKSEFNIIDDAIFYVATFDSKGLDGFESGSLRDIEKGDKVRAFDVTEENDLADIVIIVKASDVSKL